MAILQKWARDFETQPEKPAHDATTVGDAVINDAAVDNAVAEQDAHDKTASPGQSGF
jgi:hypothetical protein